MAIAASDNFNRANNPSSLGTATTGQVWAQVPGEGNVSVGHPYGIVSNTGFCAGTGGESGDALVALETGIADSVGELKLMNATAGTLNNLRNQGILFRYVDSTHYIFLTYARGGGGLFRLYIADGGVPINRGPQVSATLNNGDTIGYFCCGQTVAVYHNSVELWSVTFGPSEGFTMSATLLAGTMCGLQSGSNTPDTLPVYEDFLIQTSAACGTPTYNCTGGACVDPGDGTGTYATLAACLAGCGVDASYNCVSGVCVDPGDGSGDFPTLLECELSGCTPRMAETMTFDAGEGSEYYVVAQVSDSGDELRSKTLKSIRTTGIRTNVSGMAFGFDVNQEISTEDLETGTRTNTRMTTRPQDFADSAGVTQSERKQINVANAVLSTVRIEGDDTGNEQRDRIDEIVVEQAQQGVRR